MPTKCMDPWHEQHRFDRSTVRCPACNEPTINLMADLAGKSLADCQAKWDGCSCVHVQRDVAAFHAKFDFAVGKRLDTAYSDLDVDRELRTFGMELRDLSRKFQAEGERHQENGDERLYRLHLMVEELGELACSMGLRDEVLTADALGDLQYVVVGTAVTFDIPLDAVHAEIHHSNMTKSRDPADRRMRRKDPKLGYVKPDIRAAIERGRTA